ncbi:glycosyltransferase family 2 protein [Shimia sp.]|uniref:glycosyltransferase family 2 protein n=1 Tax=Shimia sp. TaxID=1954381 RepID=UPI00356538B1
MSRYIVSLTSVPPRFPGLQRPLQSLLDQSVRPEKVLLYLSRHYPRYPDWDGRLPEVPEGVEIRHVDHDWGPATKILPALRDFAGEDLEILFCDDDQIYVPTMAARFLAARRRHPQASIASSGMACFPPPPGASRRRFVQLPRMRPYSKYLNPAFLLRLVRPEIARLLTGRPYIDPVRRNVLRPGYADGFEGFSGVMVRPEFFPEEVFDIPDFARPVDDVWLSGHATRLGHAPWIVGGLFYPRLMPQPTEDHENDTALYRSQFGGATRDDSNLETVRYFQKEYGLWS